MRQKYVTNTVFQDIQTNLDRLGFLGHRDIASGNLEDFTAPVPARSEYEWYGSFLFLSQDRIQRYADFEDMDDHPFTSAIFDIYAEEATVKNNNGHIIDIKCDNEKAKAALEELFFERINIDFKGYEICRGLAKFGDEFRFMVLDKERKGILYLKDMPAYSVYRLEQDNRLIAFVQYGPNGQAVTLDPFSVVHWRLGMTKDKYRPYGVSLLDPARRHFRQLKLMEDAMVVYRISRAPERRMFFINVGRMPPAKAQGYIEQIIGKFRKQPVVKMQGKLEWRSHNMSVDEDFYIPVRDGNDGTRIEQLPGAENLNQIDDVRWLKDQITTFAKIPRVYLQDAEGGSAERRENLQIQDVRFAKSSARFQNFFLEGLAKVGIIHLLLQGFTKREAMSFVLKGNQASFEAEKLLMEIEGQRIDTMTKYIESGFPRAWAMQKVFNLTPVEIDNLTDWRRAEDLIMAQREAEVDAYRTASASGLEQKFTDYFEKTGTTTPSLELIQKITKKKIEQETPNDVQVLDPKLKDKIVTDPESGKLYDKETGKEIDPQTMKPINPNEPSDPTKPKRDQINPSKPRSFKSPEEPYSVSGRTSSIFGSKTVIQKPDGTVIIKENSPQTMVSTRQIMEIVSPEVSEFIKNNEDNDSKRPVGIYAPNYEFYSTGESLPLTLEGFEFVKSSNGGEVNGLYECSENNSTSSFRSLQSKIVADWISNLEKEVKEQQTDPYAMDNIGESE